MIRRLLLVLFSFVMLSVTGVAQANPPGPAGGPGAGPAMGAPRAGGRVEVRVLVVHATDADDRTDPALRELQSSLQFLRYRGYHLLDRQNVTLQPNGDTTVTITGGRRVQIRLLDKNPERARFRVTMYNPAGKATLDTTVSINRNGTFIVAGPRHADGILILPLTAFY